MRDSNAASSFAALLCIGLPFIATNIALKLFLPDSELRDARNLLKVLVLLAAYWGYVRFWERRRASELSLPAAGREAVAGLLLGAGLFSAIVAILAILGVYSVEASGTLADLGGVIADMLPKIAAGAVIEEVLFRLLLLRLLERSFGIVAALALSSLVFGFAHLGNDGATPLFALMLSVEGGLLFGAAYLLTRRVWLCAALHFSWNFVQGPIFGISVSGHTSHAWLAGSLTGPAWLTGGAFGAEGSVVAVIVCLAAAAVLLKFSNPLQIAAAEVHD